MNNNRIKECIISMGKKLCYEDFLFFRHKEYTVKEVEEMNVDISNIINYGIIHSQTGMNIFGIKINVANGKLMIEEDKRVKIINIDDIIEFEINNYNIGIYEKERFLNIEIEQEYVDYANCEFKKEEDRTKEIRVILSESGLKKVLKAIFIRIIMNNEKRKLKLI